MLKRLKITDGKLAESDDPRAEVALYIAPDETERRYLLDTLKLDEHTSNSALDPDELSRLEFESDHVAMIIKRAKTHTAADEFFFKVSSSGIFLFKDRVVIIAPDADPILNGGKPVLKIRSLQDVILKILYRTIYHFEEHLRIINTIAAEIEREVNTAMENKHLINLFTLEKSLVYYVNAVTSNATLIEKLRISAAKIGFSPENLEYLDDITIENTECLQQAQIHSNILASLMDARASIVANNLNVLMKNLNIIMIALMLPTLVVSIFSMNVTLPLMMHDHPVSFWMILFLAFFSSAVVIYLARRDAHRS